MSLQRQQRRSSEVRGCLLKNFLDMRKRSLIRSESQDSGFAWETYEPLVSSSFDAEKFLEELGFAGENAPLIPDRFIPSLIHRISNMPDETVVKLDSRVWNSIDSFKNKEHTLWFFTQSCVECDLCINDLQRSYSLPPELLQDSYDSLCPGSAICAVRNNSNTISNVQNWLACLPKDSLTVADRTKANIAHISNQSSTESGILSALSDDEAYTTENLSVYDPYRPRERVVDFLWSVPKVESSGHSSRLDAEGCQTFPSNTSSGQVRETTNGDAALHLVATRHRKYGNQTLKTIPDISTYAMPSVSEREKCVFGTCNDRNSLSFSDTNDATGKRHYSESGDANVPQTKNPSEILTEVVTSDGKGDLNKVPTCGQLRSVKVDIGSNMEYDSICSAREGNDSHYVNSETEGDDTQDVDGSIRRVSLAKSRDAVFDGTKKRHSFDAAYLTAAEKRRRFRHSHSKTHNFLFPKEDTCCSTSHLNELTADDATSGDFGILREETVEHYDELKLQDEEDGSQVVSRDSEGSPDTLLEVYDTVSNVGTSHHNGGNPDNILEVHDIVSNVDTVRHNKGNSGTTLVMSDVVSSVDASHHNRGNVDTPLRISDIVSSVYISIHNGSPPDTPFEMLDTMSDVDTSHHNGSNPDAPLEVHDTVSNVDTLHHTGGSSDSYLEMYGIVSNVDISHHNKSNVDTLLEVSDVAGNAHTSHHNKVNLDSTLEVSDIVDTAHHNGGNQGAPFGVSGIVSSVEQFKAREVPSRSDSESSEQYFSCDELLTAIGKADDDVTEHDGDEVKKKIPVKPINVFPCPPTEQRISPIKMTSQMLLRDKTLYRNYNRNTYAKYKEHFILNKILKRSLKFSVLCPIEKMSRNFLLENDSESFSQILNSNEPPNSSRSELYEKHSPSGTYGESASCDALPNSVTREKSIERIMDDKAEELDNKQSITHKPFVRNLSLTSAMFSPKCEVRLINYNGLALFSAARNTPERAISCDSGFSGTAYSNTDYTTNRTYINCVNMAVNSENEVDSENNKVYYSEVRLEVNSEEAERSLERKKADRSAQVGNFQSEKVTREKREDDDVKVSKASTNTENPCGRALKDLEDLKTAIQKAKETRMSASRELKLLQQLLHNPDSEDTETTPERTTLATSESKLSLPVFDIVNGNHEKGKTVEALSELQQKSAKEASQNKEFWEEEIRKAKEEVSEVCQEKLSIMEEKLRTTEDELSRALKENTRLKDQLELRSTAFPVCKCNAEAQELSDFSHMNGISDEDPKIISVVKPSVPTKNFWQEWDRLQSDLMKAERKADELNILLNQKLIELNRMQLTLSKQTKEMILLEKAYFQLRSHLSKKKFKSSLCHQSSAAAKTLSSSERISETSSKATDPEIPP